MSPKEKLEKIFFCTSEQFGLIFGEPEPRILAVVQRRPELAVGQRLLLPSCCSAIDGGQTTFSLLAQDPPPYSLPRVCPRLLSTLTCSPCCCRPFNETLAATISLSLPLCSLCCLAIKRCPSLSSLSHALCSLPYVPLMLSKHARKLAMPQSSLSPPASKKGELSSVFGRHGCHRAQLYLGELKLPLFIPNRCANARSIFLFELQPCLTAESPE